MMGAKKYESKSERFSLDDTRFIFNTNFSGDPARDRFADDRKKCCLVVPDEQQAMELRSMGIRVNETRPREEDDPATFVPEYYVTALLKYRNRMKQAVKYPPKVYLVTDGGAPVLLDEETVGMLDAIRARNVNVILNAYEYDPVSHAKSLYIRTMYVEQDEEDDPYAQRYRQAAAAQGTGWDADAEDPF